MPLLCYLRSNLYNHKQIDQDTHPVEMSGHLERRTEVPRDRDFFFEEQRYITQLKKYERERAEFDQSGAEFAGPTDAFVATRNGLIWMFKYATSQDSMRYDFILHYIAYHRAKIHELDAAMAPLDAAMALFHTHNEATGHNNTLPATLANNPAYMQHFNLMEKMRSKKLFYQQQATFLQEVLVHRAGHSRHIHRNWHSDGQRFYDAVEGHVASVYEADRADRRSVAEHGNHARGIFPQIYVGDVRMYPNRMGGIGEYLGENVNRS